ncbi:hypothetical protein WME75_09985 [Sorangium sp. So ce1014]|uniref:hypothetical protein n=1 Tax=Sorangium sp. So ce1014 TaxID=3133326 RepID=UPI003F5D9FDD
MDGDVFGRVSKIGRDAGEAALRALDGCGWDPYPAERCLDILVAAADGVPSLPLVLREVRNISASPLFARMLGEHSSQRIVAAVADVKGGVLDLILKNEIQKCVLRGVFDERVILTRFCEQLLDRAIISGRDGFREQHGSERVREVQKLLRPIAASAAEVMQSRPDAKRLGLARRHPRITPETDLLGGFQ